MKTCFKCGSEKELSEFYAHPKMRDGRLNKCKECTKLDAKFHRDANLEQIREKERVRHSLPASKARRVGYQKKSRALNPQKHRARAAVRHALGRGSIKKTACEVCGSPEVEAHHEDYSSPLEVQWLCFKHHRMKHGALVDGESYPR